MCSRFRVARIAGSTEATLAAVREVVKQYNASIRSGETTGVLFDDLSRRLASHTIELLSLTALRDGVSVCEVLKDETKKIAVRPGELVEIADLEVTG